MQTTDPEIERAHQELDAFNAMASLSDEDAAWQQARVAKALELPDAERREFVRATPGAYRAETGRDAPRSMLFLVMLAVQSHNEAKSNPRNPGGSK